MNTAQDDFNSEAMHLRVKMARTAFNAALQRMIQDARNEHITFTPSYYQAMDSHFRKAADCLPFTEVLFLCDALNECLDAPQIEPIHAIIDDYIQSRIDVASFAETLGAAHFYEGDIVSAEGAQLAQKFRGLAMQALAHPYCVRDIGYITALHRTPEGSLDLRVAALEVLKSAYHVHARANIAALRQAHRRLDILEEGLLGLNRRATELGVSTLTELSAEIFNSRFTAFSFPPEAEIAEDGPPSSVRIDIDLTFR